MDYTTILMAVAASIATGIVSALATISALRVHISYLRNDGEIMKLRMRSAEKRIGHNELNIVELQTQTKET